MDSTAAKKAPDASSDFIYAFEDECKIEFIDPRFLSLNTLDSESAALECWFPSLADFYLSPFYLAHRDKALNEAIRAGQAVDEFVSLTFSCQVGLMFKVTYNNLDELYEQSLNFGPNSANRSHFYVMASIFHITLFSRDLGRSGVESTPIKVYYIIQGSIFMCPPFAPLVRTKLHQYIHDFERFYDRLNGISGWSVTNGYSWNPKPRSVNREIERLCERYGFTSAEERDYVSDGNTNVFYLKSDDRLGVRILEDELARVAELAPKPPPNPAAEPEKAQA